MPAVSVIIPMYNVRPYIEDCLLSLKRQTFGDFEALCVDDGSTDGTLEAARKAGDDDARFSFLSQANAGQSAARNSGIARATGKYIVFLDSDDYYEDRALQTLFERAERDELDDLFFSARTVYEDAEARARYRDDYDDREGIDAAVRSQGFLGRIRNPVLRGHRARGQPVHLPDAGGRAPRGLSERAFVRKASARRIHYDRGSRDAPRLRPLQGCLRA